MAYESPIKINYQEGIPEFRTFHEEINEKIECRIMASVQEKMAIQINKEELIKALQYDRGQYKKGWEDARRTFQRPKGEWIRYSSTTLTCSNCKKNVPNEQTYIPMNFCTICGADMRPAGQQEDNS